MKDDHASSVYKNVEFEGANHFVVYDNRSQKKYFTVTEKFLFVLILGHTI